MYGMMAPLQDYVMARRENQWVHQLVRKGEATQLSSFNGQQMAPRNT
jgi:hypothetical protein